LRKACGGGVTKVHPYMQTHKEFLGKPPHNDAKITLHIFLANLYCVFPVRSLTVNAGMDGSGAHCGLGWTHRKPVLSDAPVRVSKDMEPSAQIARIMYWANYSFLNHGVGKLLRWLGVFDPLYAAYRWLFLRK
jgi:hypothetical protein